MTIVDLKSFASRWPVHPLSAVVEKIFVGLPTSRHAARSGEESLTLSVLRVGDLEDGRIATIESVGKVALRKISYDRFRIHSGDVLASCRGTLLKVALAGSAAEGLVASSNIAVIRPGTRVMPAIILALLRITLWQELLKSRTRSSTGLMQLTVKDFEDLPVPVPPLGVQKDLVELIDAEEQHYRNSLDAARMKRQAVSDVISHALLGRPEKETRNGSEG